MKWQQRVSAVTDLSYWRITLHSLVVATLVMGWISEVLVRVGIGLYILCGTTDSIADAIYNTIVKFDDVKLVIF